MALSVMYFRITHCLGRPNYMWDEYLYSELEKVEVRVTVSVTVCIVLLCCMGWWWWKEGRRWSPVPAHSLLFSKSTKGTTRLNVPIRRMNHYQQYYMPSQHTYCRRVWNLIQDCDVQSRARLRKSRYWGETLQSPIHCCDVTKLRYLFSGEL